MRFYGYNSETKQGAEDEDDIEASIQREVAAIGDADEKKLFTSVHIDIQCVLFFRTAPVIDPVNFVYRICEEIRANPQIRRMKYANRLTPITLFGRATEKGLEEVGRKVIGDYFQLAGESGEDSQGFSVSFLARSWCDVASGGREGPAKLTDSSTLCARLLGSTRRSKEQISSNKLPISSAILTRLI